MSTDWFVNEFGGGILLGAAPGYLILDLPVASTAVTRAKSSSPDCLRYDGLTVLPFPVASLLSNQSNAVVAAAIPLGVSLKVVAVSALDAAPENGAEPPDNSLLGDLNPANPQPPNAFYPSLTTLCGSYAETETERTEGSKAETRQGRSV